MSNITLPILYQTETFGARTGQFSSGTGYDEVYSRQGQSAVAARKKVSAPQRSTDFLVQLMVGGDPDLRKALGRRDIAVAREAAYGAAMANRSSHGRVDREETLALV